MLSRSRGGLPSRPGTNRKRGLVALSVIGILVAACGSGSTSASPGASTPTASTPTAAAAATASSATCSTPDTTLELWGWVAGWEDITKLWNDTHPCVLVNYTRTTAGPDHYNKVKAAVAAGTGAPDLAQVENQIVPSMVLAGNLEDVTAEATPSKDLFVDWTWSGVTIGGKVYAIPEDIGPMGTYYRKDVFDSVGLAFPKTWDEFRAAGVKIHAADPTHYIAHFPPGQGGFFAGFAWQNGAHWFTIEGDAWKVTIDDPASKQVADLWQGLIDDGVVKVEGDFNADWYKQLEDGTLATWTSGVWAGGFIASNAPGASGKWAAAPMPQFTAGSKAAGNIGGSTTGIVKGTQHKQEAVDFAVWLNSDPAALAIMIDKQSIYPATKSGADLPAMNEAKPYFGGQKTNDIFKEAANNVDPAWTWGPTMDQVYTDFSDVFTAATGGSGKLSDALTTLQEKTIADLKSKGINVAN